MKKWTYALAVVLPLAFISALHASENKSVQIIKASESFSPSSGQKAEIELATTTAGKLKLEVLEPDGNVIRRIERADSVPAGNYKIIWDGKDLSGQIVPDEAYSYRAELINTSGTLISSDEPALDSGGELLDNLNAVLNPTSIGFTLPESARVLVRIGLKDGPMLRNLVRWTPRVAGKNRVAWDGFDASSVIDLRQDPRTTVLVVGYKLPAHSTITYGNDKSDYLSWFEEHELAPKEVPAEQQVLSRESTRIAREFYRSVYEDREPLIKLELIESGKIIEVPYSLSGSSTLRVNADEASQWLLDESLYEVGFFINGVFVSEEEQGYLPMSWRLATDQLEPGEHVLTVNISGFDGRVGVASTAFSVN